MHGHIKKGHKIGQYGARVLAISAMAGLLSGCVTIDAPEKPIVIELNINIKQEVIYRLDRATKELIDENPEIF
jgi:YnbE-like lipoprotein